MSPLSPTTDLTSRHADWLIDLGPGAGHDGGQIVFTGTPAELVGSGTSLTAQHLCKYVAQT